jgi:hypothetical protein
MPDNIIDREADYVASLLDSGQDHQAADRLRADLAGMDRASFLTLVNQIRQKERHGVGADLNVYRSPGPGYFENALVSIDRPFITENGYRQVYQQPIAQYSFPLLDWGRWYLR